MTTTYEKIATTTLGSDTKDVTFSSIPATYTDLVMVINCTQITVAASLWLRFNSDSGSNYSWTEFRGNGSSALTDRGSNYGQTYFANNVIPNTVPGAFIVQFQNYSNTTTYKTFLSRGNATSGAYAGASAIVGLWRSTAAINSILISQDGGTTYKYGTGSTFTLYGIKAE
jgi:hypothetical protein